MCPAKPASPSVARQTRIAAVGREAGRTVVWVRGEHDISTVAELSAVLAGATALRDDGLVVDLEEVRFIDASTIGAIVSCRNALALQGRRLVIRSPAGPARRLLDICGLQSLLEPRQFMRPSPPAVPRERAPGATLVSLDVST